MVTIIGISIVIYITLVILGAVADLNDHYGYKMMVRVFEYIVLFLAAIMFVRVLLGYGP